MNTTSLAVLQPPALLERFKRRATLSSIFGVGGRRTSMAYCACLSNQMYLYCGQSMPKATRASALGFDTSYWPFEKALRVEYYKEMPTLPLDSILRGEQEVIKTIITTKSESWAYQQEWRIALPEGDKQSGYDINALTAVHLGIKVNPQVKERIVSALRDSHKTVPDDRRSDGIVINLRTHRIKDGVKHTHADHATVAARLRRGIVGWHIEPCCHFGGRLGACRRAETFSAVSL